ncbi:dTDP-4-dehydrorhamnose 3,5-epimerase [Desulfosarcina alkanivorans]|uniref:dTDP-4-dehydrorhamnose 3,5-epimerase n=1 Tax=Desulfosarcina alkanivorans TaxID=571177 RepID=A0A5K7YLP5_9BACT|nr:NAD-dependent epimerase/dehydratase family protein [Desulfosarcina alkanivorans]BBO67254.1 dTDP-4-dehydrorhamnose 3,5-epimerase [Desulfosarcina alkanivorans]
MSEDNKYKSVLVTGSTGFLGSRVVERLINERFKVRAFVRPTSRADKIKKLGAELCVGDVKDVSSLKAAFKGVDFVVHAAADTDGSVDGGQRITVQGTLSVLKLCKKNTIEKLVYISSCNVYDVFNRKKGDVITEDSPLEEMPFERGAYSYAKFQAEKAIRHAIKEDAFPIVCLRPGTIFGPDGEIYSPMMGFSVGRKVFITIGDGKFVLPLVYVDNVADAICVALQKKEANNQIYNLIDPHRLTKKEYIEVLLEKIYPRAIFLYLPYPILYLLVYLQEILFKAFRIKPFLTRYRLESSQKKVIYDGRKISRELEWKYPVSLDDALQNIINHYNHN